MKKLLLTLLALGLFMNLTAQNCKVDKNGNYTATPSNTSRKSEAKPTGKTFTDSKGKSYPVYVSKTGKPFVKKTSEKSGKEYPYYLKPQQ